MILSSNNVDDVIKRLLLFCLLFCLLFITLCYHSYDVVADATDNVATR